MSGMLRRHDLLGGMILHRPGWGLFPMGCGTREASRGLRARPCGEGVWLWFTPILLLPPSPRTRRTLGSFEPRLEGVAHL